MVLIAAKTEDEVVSIFWSELKPKPQLYCWASLLWNRLTVFNVTVTKIVIS